MAIRTASENQSQYKYNRAHLKRIPFDVQQSYYNDVLLPAANAAGIGVNTYIKQAIAEKIARDTSAPPEQE